MDNLQASAVSGLFNNEPEPVSQHQQVRLTKFASHAVDKIREAHDCAFSRVDPQDLARGVAAWFESCAQAMLRGDYSLIDQWVCRQGTLAVDRGTDLEDFLKFLRICRASAIEVERWDPELLSPIDEVINETLRAGAGVPAWKISADLDYLSGKVVQSTPVEHTSPVNETPAVEKKAPVELLNERRLAGRAPLRFPIRVSGNGATGYHLDFIAKTESFSPNGLYFVANEPCIAGLRLYVAFPRAKDASTVSRKFSAKVVRVDRRADKSRGIAIQFLEPISDITS